MTHDITIDEQALKLVQDFVLPQELGFGQIICPVMIEANYDKGSWSALKLVPKKAIELDPTCKVLHYAQEIFEGLKAYAPQGRGPYLFRPDQNALRFNESAERMAMAKLPEHYFTQAVEVITSYCSHLIPGAAGDSLYIRPFMIATDQGLGIKPSESFKFLVIASPSQSYFKSGSINVLIEREAVRACPGGIGHAKTGGNYAASLLSMIKAKEAGFDQVLWLDALTKTTIEELSGMNLFAVYGDEIITPKLTETILDGITRKSLLTLANHLDIKIKETTISINELISDIKSDKCQEVFSCGTAVVITPVSCLGEKSGEKFHLKHSEGPMALRLKEQLVAIQEGRSEDPFGWRKEVARK
jgi:branched-chain amino acid aminotransferase